MDRFKEMYIQFAIWVSIDRKHPWKGDYISPKKCFSSPTHLYTIYPLYQASLAVMKSTFQNGSRLAGKGERPGLVDGRWTHSYSSMLLTIIDCVNKNLQWWGIYYKNCILFVMAHLHNLVYITMCTYRNTNEWNSSVSQLYRQSETASYIDKKSYLMWLVILQ